MPAETSQSADEGASSSIASGPADGADVRRAKTGDPSAAQQLAWQALQNLRQQASSLASFDVFLVLAAVTLMLTPLVLLMKRSVAEKGAHIGHE